MDKPKVLIVHNYYQIPGGEDTVVENESTMLQENGHEVMFYTRHNDEIKNRGLFGKIKLFFESIFSLKTYKEIKRIIREEKIDVVHVHNTLPLISPSVYYAAFRTHTPVVQTIHNFRLLCPGATFYRNGHICEDCVTKGLTCAIIHNCYRGSKLQTLACAITIKIHRMLGTYKKLNYICLTEFNKEKLLELNKGKKQLINPKKVFMKPNFTFDCKSGGTETSDYFVFVGRIEEIKGIYVLLEAFSMLPDEKLIIIGSGTEYDAAQRYVEEHIMTNASFTGFLNRTELNPIVSSAKATIVTSQWYETFGMIIAESYSHSVPAIVGNIGNIKDLVQEGNTGVKFTYNSAKDLALKIKEFKKYDRDTMGVASYQKFIDEFSPESNYKMIDEIYRKVIGLNER